ncbi:YgjV family protein [Vibrio cionasavignyae]|uniref:YgjV family protein n=1 Tax=Vibrio cionasavignyae TaxID=2910252 RepID=UPI003D0DF901
MGGEVTAQVFGLISFALGMSTFYQKDDKKLKILMLLLNLNHLVHFILMGSMVSAASALLSTFRTGMAIYTRSLWVATLFVIISVAVGVTLAQDAWQLWPIAGTVIGTISIFVLKDIPLRLGFLLGATCWLINNISIGSIGGSLLEASVIMMNVLTIARLYRDKRSADIVSQG